MGDKLTKYQIATVKRQERKKEILRLLEIGRETIKEIGLDSPEWKALLEHQGPTVYILRCDKYYKIGRTEGSIITRINTLQIGNPFLIELVFALKVLNAGEIERKLHKKFYHKKIRGEWFELVTEDFWEIERFIKDIWATNVNH